MFGKGNYGGIYAFISMTMMLFLAGLLAIVSLFAYELGFFIKEQVVITVFFNTDVDSVEVRRVYEYLKQADYVKEVNLIDKEKGLQMLKEVMPDIEPELLGYNPLFDVIEVRLRAENVTPAKVEQITQEWKKKFPYISEVRYNANLIKKIENYVKRGVIILAVFTLLLVISTVVIINSTLRLAIYTRRFLIKNMQMIGAGWWFIVRPLLTKAFLLAVLSFLVASALIVGIFYKLIEVFPELKMFVLNRQRELLVIAVGLLAVGLLVSVFTTIVSVTRYLRMRLEDLY